MSDLAQALMVAIRTHASQSDRQDEPYLLHVLRVVEAVSDEAKVVAALHDVIEDGEDELPQALLGDAEWQALAYLTREEGEPYASYIRVISEGYGWAGTVAREVKLADLRDNLGRIPPEPPRGMLEWRVWHEKWGSLRARYEKAIAVLEQSSLLTQDP